MSDAHASENKDGIMQEAVPAIKKVAVVQCQGFRCLAYRDAETWRDFQTGKELPEVEGIVFEFAV